MSRCSRRDCDHGLISICGLGGCGYPMEDLNRLYRLGDSSAMIVSAIMGCGGGLSWEYGLLLLLLMRLRLPFLQLASNLKLLRCWS